MIATAMKFHQSAISKTTQNTLPKHRHENQRDADPMSHTGKYKIRITRNYLVSQSAASEYASEVTDEESNEESTKYSKRFICIQTEEIIHSDTK